MRPLYEETYGAGVMDFNVSRLDKHSIVMTWKRTLSLPKNKQLIGVLDAELITGWTVTDTKLWRLQISDQTKTRQERFLHAVSLRDIR